MADIFLSYSRQDVDFMRRTRDFLRSAGFSVWTDELNLEPGSSAWQREIEAAIRAATRLVVICSPDAKESKWVNIELTIAEMTNVSIIPVVLRGNDDLSAIPTSVLTYQRIDARRDPNMALKRLLETLQAQIRGGSNPTKFTPLPTPATIVRTVSKLGAADYRTITEAMQRAPEGATIYVRPGLYRESVQISKSVELIGEGSRDDIIIESVKGSCLWMDTDYAVVRGLSVRQQANADGLYSPIDIRRGRLTLEDCDITSEAGVCIGVYNAAANPVIRRCQIHDSAQGGVFFTEGAQGIMENCHIHGSALSGVEIKGGARLTMRQSSIYNNTVGLLAWSGGRATLENCEIHGNQYSGVEIRLNGYVSAQKCSINDNNEYAIYAHDNGTGRVEGCDLRDNKRGSVLVQSGGDVTQRDNQE